MSTTMLIIIASGLTAAVGWGIADFLGAKAAKRLGPLVSALLIGLIGAVLFSVLYVCLWRTAEITIAGSIYAVWGALFVTVGTAALYKGMAVGPVSLVAPLSGAYPIVTAVLAVAVFNASLSIQQIAGIVLLMSGVFLAAGLVSVLRPGMHPFSQGPLFGLGAAGAWGIGYTLVGQSIARIGWQAATFIELWLIVLFMAMLLCIFDRKAISGKKLQQALRYPATWWAGVTLLIAGLGLNFGLSREMALGAVITAISACYPAITMVLALRHFKEEIRVVPLLGAVICIIGVVILSLG